MTSYESQGFQEDSMDSSSRRSHAVASTSGKWGDAKPVHVGFADSFSPKKNKEAWQYIYRNSGMPAANEKEQMAIRAGVYVYCAKNGTSRVGEYADDMQIANGAYVHASLISRAAGRVNIRKFLRANMVESYEFFKETRVMEEDERFIAKAAGYGIAPECAFAMADWLDECPLFTPAEARAHDLVFVKSIERARRARGGRTLEEVEQGQVDAAVHANGPVESNGVKVSDF